VVSQGRARAPLEACEGHVDRADVDVIRGTPEPRRRMLANRERKGAMPVARDGAVRRMSRAGIGNDQRADARDFGKLMGVGCAGPAIGHQHEISWIVARTQRHAAQEIRHLVVRDLADAGGSLLHRHAERLGDVLAHRLVCRLDIETHLAAEEILGIDDAEDHIRIRDRRLETAAPVARRARRAAGALRPDSKMTVAHARD